MKWKCGRWAYAITPRFGSILQLHDTVEFYLFLDLRNTADPAQSLHNPSHLPTAEGVEFGQPFSH